MALRIIGSYIAYYEKNRMIKNIQRKYQWSSVLLQKKR